MEDLLKVSETAKLLRCHPQTLYKKNDLPRLKVPGIGVRYIKSDIDKYLDSCSEKHTVNYIQVIDNKTNNLLFPPDYSINKSGGISEMAKAKNKTRFNFGYGAIYQRKTKTGEIRWYLDFKDANGKRIQKVAAHAITREDAYLALREEVAKIFRREHGIEQDKQKISFKSFSELYMTNYSRVKKRAWDKSDKVYLHANLNPFFGDYLLIEIDTELIEQFIAKRLKDEVKKSTINRDLSCLKKIFNKAVDWGYLAHNPALRIKPFPEKDNSRTRILTKEEEGHLLEAAADHLKAMILIALNTGMRLGEILGLQWGQIDLNQGQIRVERTKNGKTRYLPINRSLQHLLYHLKEKGVHNGFVFVNSKTGKPFTTVKTAFNAACHRAEIQGLWFHDLRRTFASRILQRGADIETVRELLGHHSVVVTQRYTCSNIESKRKAVALLLDKKGKNDQNRENLLHSCDMENHEEIPVFVIPSKSVN